jgi:hypothetical protein
MVTVPLAIALLVVADARASSDIERRAVEARRAITSGEVVVRWHNQRWKDGPAPVEKRGQHHIWFDQRQHRQDVLFDDQPATRYVTIWAGERFLYWTNELSGEGHRLVATIADRSDEGATLGRRPLDPRTLGMACAEFMNLENKHIDSVIANPARLMTRTKEDTLQGVRCIVVTIQRNPALTTRAWIAPERGYSVLRLESEFRHDPEKHRGVAESNLQRHDRSGIWFPTHYVYEELIGGQRVTLEKGEVKIISLNEKIPAETFTFAGVGVPAGWPVNDFTRPDVSDRLAWDGRQVVSLRKAQREIEAAWRLNIFYAACAVVLALVSAVLFWRFLSLRQAT